MELVGNPNVVDEGLRMTAPEGTYLEIGNINVGWETTFDPSWILFGNRRIIGVAHYEAEHLKGALDLMVRTKNEVPLPQDPVTQVPARRRSTRPSASRRTATLRVERSSRTSGTLITLIALSPSRRVGSATHQEAVGWGTHPTCHWSS